MACITTTTAFLGGWWWAFDLTSHFRVQYAVTLVIFSGIGLAFRKYKFAFAFALFSLVNTALLLSFYFGTLTANSSSIRLKLLLINVRTENSRFDLVRKFIEEKKPDMVLLEEVDDRWLSALQSLNGEFPHTLVAPREDNFGIALFSKLPLNKAEVIQLGAETVPSLTAEIRL